MAKIPGNYKELIMKIEDAGPTEDELMLMSIIVLMGTALEELVDEPFAHEAASYCIIQCNDYVKQVYNPTQAH